MAADNLKLMNGLRFQFEARIGSFDTKQGYAGPQKIICLKNIKQPHESGILIPVSWLNCGKWSSALKTGDQIVFEARVNVQKKQKLERLTKVVVVEGNGSVKDFAERERDLMDKALSYGSKLWETTQGINQIVIQIEELDRRVAQGYWMEAYSDSLLKLATKLIFEEWSSNYDDIITRLHEFIVWLKLMIDNQLGHVSSRIRKEFYRHCMEQWFYFYQGEA